jgi:transposase-like protein
MANKNLFKYFKTSPEIIRLAVMFYVRYPLSYRQVEDILHERGVDICHETVRFWVERFGSKFAREIRKNRAGHHSNWQCIKHRGLFIYPFWFLFTAIQTKGVQVLTVVSCTTQPQKLFQKAHIVLRPRKLISFAMQLGIANSRRWFAPAPLF